MCVYINKICFERCLCHISIVKKTIVNLIIWRNANLFAYHLHVVRGINRNFNNLLLRYCLYINVYCFIDNYILLLTTPLFPILFKYEATGFKGRFIIDCKVAFYPTFISEGRPSTVVKNARTMALMYGLDPRSILNDISSSLHRKHDDFFIF